MRPIPKLSLFRAWPALVLLAGLVRPGASAAADLTIHGKYMFADGDTATRATYYSDTHMRASMFDGNEAIYDAQKQEIIFLNHTTKRFWRGPLSRADAIVDSLNLERDKPFFEAAQEKREEWRRFMEKFNSSLKTVPLEEERKVAGKQCKGWEISAGHSMVHTRWVAMDLVAPDFTRDLFKILLLPALDPVSRTCGRLLLQARANSLGVILDSETEINTPTQKTTVSWRAYRLESTPIPPGVWEVPKGYVEIKF